jgi:hypothetical protein
MADIVHGDLLQHSTRVMIGTQRERFVRRTHSYCATKEKEVSWPSRGSLMLRWLAILSQLTNSFQP